MRGNIVVKRFICFAAAFLTVLALSGCVANADVRLRLVVHAIGVDIEDDGAYCLSYQVFTPKKSSSKKDEPVDATSGNVMTVAAYGRTIYEAQKNLEFQTGKEVFTGDVELIVLGESFIGKDISKVLSYFWNNADIYMGVNTAFAKGAARDVVGAELEQGTAATELLTEMINASAAEGDSVQARLIDVCNRLNEKSGCLMIPALTVKKADNSKGAENTNIYDTATGVFDNILVVRGTPAEYLSREQTKGICFTAGGVKATSLELDSEGKRASVSIEKIKTRRKVKINERGYPVIDLKISGGITVLDNPENIGEEELRQAAQREIIRLCSLAYEAAIKNHGADVFEIGKLLRQRERKYYDNIGDSSEDFSRIVMNTEFGIEVKLKLNKS